MAGPLAVVGLLTLRAGWLGLRRRLRVRRRPHRGGLRDDLRNEPAFAAAARVAGPPLLAAGSVSVLGAVAAALQPTLTATLLVVLIVLAGACGLALAARRLADRAAATVCARTPACAGCPYRPAEAMEGHASAETLKGGAPSCSQ